MSWQTIMIPGFEPEGSPILSIIAKRTYQLSQGTVKLAPEQHPLNQADIYEDESNSLYSEVLAETDLIAYKPKTDIVVIGNAHAPNGKKVYCLDCEVVVGPAHKKITIYGERKIKSNMLKLKFTDPVPFEEQKIGYTNAYGGRAKLKDGALVSFPTNPLGRGFYVKGGFEDYSELLVPLCEDPNSPVHAEDLILDKYSHWINAPKPASFGWTKQTFFPRYTYAGIIPEMLSGAIGAGDSIDIKAPKLNYKFFQGASDGLCDYLLAGNEPVKLTYMDPEHPCFEFMLPGQKPGMVLKLGSETFELEPALQTVLIDKNNDTLEMVWRGCKKYGGIDELEKMKIGYFCEGNQ